MSSTILVWVLMSFVNDWRSGAVQYSPPVATLEDCRRMQIHLKDTVIRTTCVQINLVK